MKIKKAIQEINQNGILLVFPINNRKQPLSIWSQFYPRSKMQWSWDNDADHRVAQMWMLMKKLSDCREVVYSKWYQGRATFFSRTLFAALLKQNEQKLNSNTHLSRPAREILEILESDSPLSTKQVKKMAELQGKDNERIYQRATKELFKNFHIVAFGEVEDGAFPSLAMGSSKNLYEDLWVEAQQMTIQQSRTIIEKYMPQDQLFRKYLDKV